MSTKINKCENCGSGIVVVEHFYKIFYVMCKDCKNTTVDCVSEQEAIKEWNKT